MITRVCPLGALQAFFDAVSDFPEDRWDNDEFCAVLDLIVKLASALPTPKTEAGRVMLRFAHGQLSEEIRHIDPDTPRYREATEDRHRLADSLVGGKYAASRYRANEVKRKRQSAKRARDDRRIVDAPINNGLAIEVAAALRQLRKRAA